MKLSALQRLFSKQINSITVAALLVALSSLISRFLGVFRDGILAGAFGAGDTLDVYYAAFRIPDLVFNLLVLGALSAGFVPILSEIIKDRKCDKRYSFEKSPNKAVWELSNSIINLLGIILILVSLLGFFCVPWIVKYITPGFSGEKLNATIDLTRIMFLSPIFLGISSVLGGILQSFKRFFVYSLAPIFYNVGIIIGALFFAPKYGVYGLAWGVVMGALFHMLIGLPTVISLGYIYKPIINIRDNNVKKIFFLMIPRTMSLAISQINLLVITIIASTLASGSLAIFNLANNLQSFPVGIFGISFAVAAFPTLSSVAFNKKKLVDNFSRVLRQILFFIIPSTSLLLTLREQIVRVILGSGKFSWEDTNLTVDVLAIFVISLFAQASIPLLVRMFYARHDSKIPFYIGLFSAFINVLLSVIFSTSYGIKGLVLAFSIASIINFIVLWIVMSIELSGLNELNIFKALGVFLIGAIVCGFVVQGSEKLIKPFLDLTRFWGVFIQGAFAGILGILSYGITCYLFKNEELLGILNSFKRKLAWNKVNTGDHGEARGI